MLLITISVVLGFQMLWDLVVEMFEALFLKNVVPVALVIALIK